MSLVGARGAGWLRAAITAGALLAAGWIVEGCTKSATLPAERPLGLDTVRRPRGSALHLALLEERDAGHVEFSLWLDAGARDADPPQVAVLAAWAAAETAGPDVRAEVLPDGIELTLACARAEIAACLSRLARGLSARNPSAARLAALRARLAAARRAADAREPERQADQLALEALYGEDARGFVPFGRAEDDARADAARVGRFVADHFGPDRALLIAAGALDWPAFEQAAAAAFGRAPRAARPRTSERPRPSDEGGVAVEVAAGTRLSAALSAPTLEAAHAGAAALRARLERGREALGLRGEVRGHVFEVRGGALALLRAEAKQAERATRLSANEVERLRIEGLPEVPLPAAPHDPRALARRLGLRWVARGPGHGVRLALGLGALVAGGRADHLDAKDPDAALRERARERLEAAREAGRALAEPALQGDLDERSAALSLENGARLALRARGGEEVAIAVRFGRGAAREPPLLHGRAALLATLASTACAGLSPEQLRERVRRLGGELVPRVDGDSFGLLLTAKAEHWQAAVALALDCALHPALERRYLSTARLRLTARLGPEAGSEALAAEAAARVWPSAPGALAPWGSPERQASVSLRSLRELWRASARGPMLSVGIVGPLPISSAAAWAARRMVLLDGSAAALAVETAAAVQGGFQPAAQPEGCTLGLALWRAPQAEHDPAGALAFAALMRAALDQSLGVSAVWHGGGVTPEGPWAAVGLSGAPESLAAAAAALRSVAAALPQESVARAADQAVSVAERASAAALASPAGQAEALARAPFEAADPPPSRARARAAAAQLARTEPTWVPLR